MRKPTLQEIVLSALLSTNLLFGAKNIYKSLTPKWEFIRATQTSTPFEQQALVYRKGESTRIILRDYILYETTGDQIVDHITYLETESQNSLSQQHANDIFRECCYSERSD